MSETAKQKQERLEEAGFAFDPDEAYPGGEPAGTITGPLEPAPEHPDHAAMREKEQALADKLSAKGKR